MEELSPAKLKELYYERGLSQRQIAERFDLSQPCISKKMKSWDIKSDYNGFWSEEEVRLLEELYPDRKQLEPRIDRSWNPIKLKAMDIGLARDQDKYRKSDEVAERLRNLARESEVNVRFSKVEEISYVLGVVDGDGFHDNRGAIGLETKSEKFADKFSESLYSIGLNPGRGRRREKETLWASSKKLIKWLMSFSFKSKFNWLKEKGDVWKYIEGAYDSDGDFSNPGPRIC